MGWYSTETHGHFSDRQLHCDSLRVQARVVDASTCQLTSAMKYGEPLYQKHKTLHNVPLFMYIAL